MIDPPTRFDASRLYDTQGLNPGASPNTGTYTISLSTTSTPVDGLDPTLTDNIGPNNTVVLASSLPSVSGDVLRFLLSTPFTYDPTQGNLLINVSSADAGQPGPNFFFDTNGFPVPNNGISAGGTTLQPA